jgi:hypothetical protein
MKNTLFNPWRAVATAAMLIACLSPCVSAGERGRCATAMLPWPIILPDESNQPPGALTVCMERKITGVTALHEVRIGGYPVGMFMSRIGTGESPAGDSVVLVFERNALNEHRLIGYTLAEGTTRRTYALYDPKSLRKQGKSLRVATLDLTDESSVWIAAGGGLSRHATD